MVNYQVIVIMQFSDNAPLYQNKKDKELPGH